MKEWNVVLSDVAESDLDGIYTYIAETLLEPVTAWRQIERIREAIEKLNIMPERGALLLSEPWRSKGLRRVFADNYTVIYEIQEAANTVAVVAILYSRRDIDDVLKQEERWQDR